MDNCLTVFSRVKLSVDISATISDDCFSLSVSVTLRFDMVIFGKLSRRPEMPTHRELSIDRDCDEYLNDKTQQLKNIFDEWATYLNNHQKDIGNRVFGSMEELTEDLKSVCKEQIRCRNKIEVIIAEVYDKLKSANSLSKEKTEAVLKFLSNSYQLIRDLSLTVELGKQFLEMSMEASQEADDIRKKLFEKYAHYEIIKQIEERKNLSDKIAKNAQHLSELNCEYHDLEASLSKKSDLHNLEQRKAQSKSECVDLFESSLQDLSALENSSKQERLAIIEQEISAYEERISKLSEDNGLFSKNKSQKAIYELKKLLEESKKRKEYISLLDKNSKFTIANINNEVLCIDEVLDKGKQDIVVVKEEMSNLKKEQEKLLAKYEKIAQFFI